MALDLSATATRILSTLGDPNYVKLVRKTSTYDPVTGAESAASEQVIGVIGAVVKIPEELKASSRIQSTDRMVIIDGQVKPQPEDFIRVGGQDLAIVSIEEINHAGTPQAYEVVCRG